MSTILFAYRHRPLLFLQLYTDVCPKIMIKWNLLRARGCFILLVITDRKMISAKSYFLQKEFTTVGKPLYSNADDLCVVLLSWSFCFLYEQNVYFNKYLLKTRQVCDLIFVILILAVFKSLNAYCMLHVDVEDKEWTLDTIMLSIKTS